MYLMPVLLKISEAALNRIDKLISYETTSKRSEKFQVHF